MKDVSPMKSNQSPRSVTTEVFFVYFLGYIAIFVILILAINLSFKLYEISCSIRTYNKEYFEMIEKKIEDDYITITDEDLKNINGFIFEIDNNIKIGYSTGYIDKERINDIKLEDFINLLGFKTKSEFKLRPQDILSRNIFKNFNNAIVTVDGGKNILYIQDIWNWINHLLL